MTELCMQPGFSARMREYLREMFPIRQHLAFSALLYAAVAAFVQRAHGRAVELLSWHAALGVWSVFSMLLTLRLMDELKDCDIDERLFPERPLPSGRVRARDIAFSLVTVVAVCLVANASDWSTLISAVIVLAYATLMFRHFFAREALRASLPLTLATHTPIVPMMVMHGVVVCVVGEGLGWSDLRWRELTAFVLMCWMLFLGWEICRKIRAPQQEDAYVTYSKLFGPDRAVAFAGLVQGLGIAAGVYLFFALSASPLYVAMLLGGFGVCVVAYYRFLRDPTPKTAVLKGRARFLAIVVLLAQVVEFGVVGS